MARESKRTGKELAKTYRFWFRKKYNLPPNDPRYLSMTDADIIADYWAYYYDENGNEDEFEADGDYDEKVENLDDVDFSELEDIINGSSEN